MNKALHLFMCLWSFLCIAWIGSQMHAIYAHEMINMQYPLERDFVLRNDTMGKGHYGASRGGGKRSHTGIDLLGVLNEPIRAVGSGRVIYAKEKGGYGKMVKIRHSDGSETRYAHLSNIHISLGRWLYQNQVLGTLGKSGNAISRSILPHVHFEWRVNESPQDPTRLFSPTEFEH
ncbi:MAG: murein DD-endopeptidase MepM/ murein hydrolase activator NlpD [Candidatus Omnitrophota bacterium]|jgi:murein DD-endopeptidase MepM/ murein hydrolase activator NlpD